MTWIVFRMIQAMPLPGFFDCMLASGFTRADVRNAVNAVGVHE